MAAAVHSRARARSVQEPPCCLPVRGAEGPLKREAAPDVHGRLPSHSPLVAPRPPVLVRGPRQHANPKPVPFTFKCQRQDLPSTEGGGLGDGLDVARSCEEPLEKASLPPHTPAPRDPRLHRPRPALTWKTCTSIIFLRRKAACHSAELCLRQQSPTVSLRALSPRRRGCRIKRRGSLESDGNSDEVSCFRFRARPSRLEAPPGRSDSRSPSHAAPPKGAGDGGGAEGKGARRRLAPWAGARQPRTLRGPGTAAGVPSAALAPAPRVPEGRAPASDWTAGPARVALSPR